MEWMIFILLMIRLKNYGMLMLLKVFPLSFYFLSSLLPSLPLFLFLLLDITIKNNAEHYHDKLVEMKKEVISLKKKVNWDGYPHSDFKDWNFTKEDDFIDVKEEERGV